MRKLTEQSVPTLSIIEIYTPSFFFPVSHSPQKRRISSKDPRFGNFLSFVSFRFVLGVRVI